MKTGAASHHGLPPLGLVDGEVHALAEQDLQRILDALLSNEPLKVRILAARELEQASIWTGRRAVDAVSDLGEEVFRAPFHTRSLLETGLLDRHWVPQQARHGGQESRAGDQIVARKEDHGISSHPDGHPRIDAPSRAGPSGDFTARHAIR